MTHRKPLPPEIARCYRLVMALTVVMVLVVMAADGTRSAMNYFGS